ncbi:MAG: hypothetical protein GY859_13855 [Desulfobacterales bacterium]|nr:hypothetical protein [Desulfobacterales bacterium]
MSKQGKHEKTTTYLQCYGVADSFKPRSRLTEKAWGVTGNDKYVKLRGYWKDSGITAVTENYFVVESINKKPVNAAELHGALAKISRETIKKKYSGKYAKNVAYFASDSSLGYEYPPLSEKNVKAIRAKGNPFSYKKLLRYAFAASHAYSIEKCSDSELLEIDYDIR